jgi:hypothetical protein
VQWFIGRMKAAPMEFCTHIDPDSPPGDDDWALCVTLARNVVAGFAERQLGLGDGFLARLALLDNLGAMREVTDEVFVDWEAAQSRR